VKSLVWAPNALADLTPVAATPQGPGQIYTLINRGPLDVVLFGTKVVPLAQAGDASSKLPAQVACSAAPSTFPADAPNIAPPPTP
jgi:hypothetical protein